MIFEIKDNNTFLYIFTILFVFIGSIITKLANDKLISSQTQIIHYEDLENNIKLTNYFDKELFEFRDIKYDRNKISFITKNYKIILIRLLLGFILLTPTLILYFLFKIMDQSLKFTKIIELSKVIIFLFLLISAFDFILKYILFETLIIDLETKLCTRKKTYSKDIYFNLDEIKNILIIKNKISSEKYYFDIFFEIDNSKRFKITSIGKHNFFNYYGDNLINTLQLAKMISFELRKNIIIHEL